jgi:biopolymer transport protein ExbB
MTEILKQGGVVMYPLGACSVLTLMILIERWWHFRQAERTPSRVIAEAQTALARGGNPHPVWADAPSPSVRAVKAALANLEAAEYCRQERVRAALASERLRLSAHLSIVGTIGNLSPFIGLFGTVLGIIRAFRDIGQVGAAGPAVVATGISEALVATATGLFVAISAVIVYNLLLTWQSRLFARAELVATEVLQLVAEARDGHLNPVV